MAALCLGAVLTAVLLAVGTPRGAAGQDMGTEGLLEQGRAAGISVERLRAVDRRARQAGLGDEATASLLRPAVALAEQGLPQGAVVSMALEGLAKQVSPDRIQQSLHASQVRTEKAGRLIRRWASSPKRKSASEASRERLITVTAETLRQGVPAREVTALLGRLSPGGDKGQIGRVTGAVGVLPAMKRAGVPSEAAARLLAAAVGAGYDAESLRQMPSALQHARQESGRPVGALAKRATRGAVQGIPAAQVLRGFLPGAGLGGVLRATRPPEVTLGPGVPPGPGGLSSDAPGIGRKPGPSFEAVGRTPAETIQ